MSFGSPRYKDNFEEFERGYDGKYQEKFGYFRLIISKVICQYIDCGILHNGFARPLDLHCAYSREQILVALDFMNPANIREGVKYLSEKKTDIFFVTLNKSEKDYSETTMYNDYSISENLFHWQSQSTTSADSPVGQRYINHRAQGSKILLFVREYKSDSTGAAEPYTFLGLADYSNHTGSRPMNIVWKLHKSIPAKYLKKTNKMVVG